MPSIKQPVEPRKPACDSTFVHTVKSGDSFNAIAYRNHITPQQLQKDNPAIKKTGDISEGQKIKVSTYKNSTWDAYTKAQEKYSRDLSDYYEAERKQKSVDEKKTQTKSKHTCPNFLDDPITWLKHRLLCH